MAEIDSLIKNINSTNSKAESSKNFDQIISKENKINLIKKEFSFKNYRNYFNYFSCIVLLLASTTYLISLTGCDGPQPQCLGQLTRRYVAYFVTLIIASAFLFSLNFVFSLYNFNNYLFSFFQFFIIAYLTLIHDTGFNMKNHGGFNRIFFAMILFVSFITQNILIFIIYMLRKRFWPVLICLIIIFGSFISYVYIGLQSSCKDWDKGLGESRFDNSGNVCKIKFPKFCWMNYLNGYLDINYIFIQDCNLIRMDSKSLVDKWLKNPNAKILGYPRTEKKKYFPDSELEQFQFRVLSEIIDMEDPKISQDIKDKIELIVDFTLEKPELKVRISKDENLMSQRKAVFDQNKEKLLAKNVIHLFIDSLSRDHFKIKLPKTKNFLEKYYVSNEKEKEKKENLSAEVFQFFKFHGVSHFTYGNMIPVQFGKDYQQPHDDSDPAIFYLKYFKEKGFISCQGHGYCGREIYDLEKEQNKMIYENFDHEMNSVYCDPNFTVPGNPYGIFSGTFSYKRRCLYGKDTHDYIFEYSKHFWEAYQDSAKFIRLAFQDAHEGTGEVVKYMDDKIVGFLEFLEQKKALENTVIVFHSDHGLNMPGFYTLVDAEDFFIEKTLPSLFLFVPKNLSNHYRDQLKKKENMFLTPYDIHNTFMHLAQAPTEAYNKIGGSLFNEIDESNRTCAMFKIRDPYCNCIEEGNKNVE